MNFTQLPLPGVLAGIAVLAGVLYALQRLRVRHRAVTVVTTLFWRVAAEEAPARTLRERFRHPWAYLLILVILCLLWLAWAGPEWTQGDPAPSRCWCSTAPPAWPWAVATKRRSRP
jgi:hypothetical protein